MHDQCTRGTGGVDVCMISALGGTGGVDVCMINALGVRVG